MAKNIELKVCAPVPWFPFLTSGQGRKDGEQELWDSLDVFRPRFFYTPKVFKNCDASLYARGIAPWFKKLCRSWKPDILDAHFVWPDGVGVSKIANELGIPYIITLRGKLFECMKVSSQVRQCAKALKGAAAVISVSGGLAEAAIELGTDPEKIIVIPNGVDAQYFNTKNKTESRKKLGLPLDNRLLVTVAHLGHRKGHHEVIQALSALPDDIQLILVGGAAQDGTFETIMDVAKRFDVENRIVLAGPRPHEQVPFYYSAADASVLASYREGCPNAVLESLACGTPVIATDVGAVRDILPDPEAGRIVPVRQVEPLKEALQMVLDQKWNPESVVRASGVKSWDQVAMDVHQVFEQIMENH